MRRQGAHTHPQTQRMASAFVGPQAPPWRHPCFIDLLDGADFLPPADTNDAISSSSYGVAGALSVVAQLLKSSLPSLGASGDSITSAVTEAVSALRFGEELARLARLDASGGNALNSSTLLQVLQKLVSKLRGLQAGEMIVVPAGWSAKAIPGGGSGDGGSNAVASGRPQYSALLLALRRRHGIANALWDVAVCTASAGREYHPSYRQPLQVDEDDFDPVLVLAGVPSRTLVDSAPWFALFRGIAEPYPSAELGAQYVYETLLPFLAEAPLPRAIARQPPPPCFRRRAPATADCSRAATALECVGGLLLLAGLSATAAKSAQLAVRHEVLRATAAELTALAEQPSATLIHADAVRLRAVCRGLSRAAAAAASCGGESEGGLGTEALRPLAAMVTRVSTMTDELIARSAGFIPPIITMPSSSDAADASAFPFFGRLLRTPASVESYAGEAPPLPFLRPVHLSGVAESIEGALDVVKVLQRALYECTLLANQESLIANSACLRVALLQHLLTEIVPMPLPLDHPHRATRCFWATEPIRCAATPAITPGHMPRAKQSAAAAPAASPAASPAVSPAASPISSACRPRAPLAGMRHKRSYCDC